MEYQREAVAAVGQVFEVLDVGANKGCLLNPSEGGVVVLINLFVEMIAQVVAEVWPV